MFNRFYVTFIVELYYTHKLNLIHKYFVSLMEIVNKKGASETSNAPFQYLVLSLSIFMFHIPSMCKKPVHK